MLQDILDCMKSCFVGENLNVSCESQSFGFCVYITFYPKCGLTEKFMEWGEEPVLWVTTLVTLVALADPWYAVDAHSQWGKYSRCMDPANARHGVSSLLSVFQHQTQSEKAMKTPGYSLDARATYGENVCTSELGDCLGYTTVSVWCRSVHLFASYAG